MVLSVARLSVLVLAAFSSATGESPSAECRPQPKALSSGSVLLQVSSATQRLGAQGEGKQVTSSSIDVTEVPMQEEQVQTEIEESVCWSTCTLDGESHLCRARVLWVLNVGVVRTVPEATSLINRECAGQCACAVDEFPAPEGEWLEGVCHTATEAEPCYKSVEWARTHGIRLYPERYEGLNAASSFEEFQAFLYDHRQGPCRSPCGLCHTAQPGEPCFAAVLDVMGNASEYALTFEEVQANLHRTDASSSCPIPCNRCRTAELGDVCYGGVTWAMTHGIHIRPAWYPGLSPNSTFEDFQALLHKANLEQCPLPCSHVDRSSYASMVAAHTAAVSTPLSHTS